MRVVTRELKIALLIGFCLVLVVSVLIADHLSAARSANLADAAPGVDTAIIEPEASPPTTGQGEAIKPGPLATNPARASEPAIPGSIDSTWNLGGQIDAHAMAGAVPVMTPESMAGLAPAGPASLVAGEPAPVTIAQGVPGTGAEEPASSVASGVGDSALADVIRTLGGKLANGEITPPPAMSTESTSVIPVGPTRTTPPVEKYSTYTVASGDSLYKIAKKVYGKGELWKTLADANQDQITPNGNLKIGTALKVPTLAGTPSPAPSVAAKAGNVKGKGDAKAGRVSYTVKPGDNLGDIAKRTLGSSRRVGDILAANKGVLDDADSIRAGLVIQIPAK